MPKSTKRDILTTLIALLRERPLDEVTVTDLTERCGISRQAFYYHFPDIYAALDWGLQADLERFQQRRELDSYEGRQRLAEELLRRLREQRRVVFHAYRCFERSYVAHYLKKYVYPMILRQVEEAAADFRVSREQVEFVAELFTTGLLDILLSWLDRGMPESSLERMDDFRTVMEGSLDHALARLEEKNEGRRGNN